MAKKKYTVDILSPSSIKNLQKQLEEYADSLTYKAQLLAETLVEKGVEIARVEVADYDAIFTGELIESIHSEYVSGQKCGAIFAVVADSEHAIYVEMGTGLIGANHPYPGKLPVMYAQGNVGKANQERTGKYYWFYPGDDGEWYYTEGLPSRPFMYQTTLQLYEIVTKTAQEIFGK